MSLRAQHKQKGQNAKCDSGDPAADSDSGFDASGERCVSGRLDRVRHCVDNVDDRGCGFGG